MKNWRPNARLQKTDKGLIAISLESKSTTFHESLDKLLINPLYRTVFVHFHMIGPSLRCTVNVWFECSSEGAT